jgi:hypothetical protein
MPLLTTYAAATGRSYGARLTVPLFSLAIEAGATSVNEGGSLTFNVSGTDIVSGTYYWSINHITTASADFSASSGSFTITDNVGSFTVTTVADVTTEGSQTFTVSVLGTATGPVVATSSTITINDTSLFNYTVTPAASSVNEGASLTVNVTTVPADGTFYWTINHITTVDADFSAVNGTVVTSIGAGSFTITAADDMTTEGAQTFTISLRESSITGTVLATSTTVTVNDTSLTPAASISPAVGGVSTISLVSPPAGTRVNFGGTSCGSWIVTPNQNFTCTIKVWGAGGGAAFSQSVGGGGGYTDVYITLLKNTAYRFTAGCGGAGGSGVGNGYGSGGGAGSSVQIVTGNIPIAVAGGGGGGGFSTTGGAPGGAGGGYLAQEGGLGSGVGPAPTQAGPYYAAGGGETNGDGTPGPVGIGGRGPNGSGSPGGGANGGPGANQGSGGGGAGGAGYGTGGTGGRNGTNIPSGGGGGGAGFVGGGGGGRGSGGDGGGGGSGYWDGFRTIAGYSETGSGRTPGNSGDSDRGSAGLGATGSPASSGQPGKVVWILA